eukprot:COSAG04_NODE_1320_length_7235_cov_2.160874_1_plen_272_part_10
MPAPAGAGGATALPPGSVALAPRSLVAARSAAIIRGHVLPLPLANPQLLEMFRKEERNSRDFTFLQGGNKGFQMEFAGKFLTHATQLWKLTADPELKDFVEWFVGELAVLQEGNANGYLGSMPDHFEFKQGYQAPVTPVNPAGPAGVQPWDSWGHYHLMTGLLLHHEATQSQQALSVATKIADLHVALFAGDPHKLFAQGTPSCNNAILDSVAWLYRITRAQKYLDLCKSFLQHPLPAVDFLAEALAGVEFYAGSSPRWEGLHTVMGFAEMY